MKHVLTDQTTLHLKIQVQYLTTLDHSAVLLVLTFAEELIAVWQ